MKNGLNELKTQISLLPRLGYSRIKIDHIADSLIKLQIKIGVHLINVELSQLLTLPAIFKYFQESDLQACSKSFTQKVQVP